ncbi:MAG: spore coat protein YlbD, partial [Clostridium sp.]|nr:spore coat protein YlbD [Clostridium sp.]
LFNFIYINMSKLDNFKKFVSNHPEFADYVKKNNVSWQSFYELYDLYGEDDEIWKKYIKDDISDQISIKGLLNTLKNINIDSLEENISSIQKAVGLVEELTRETKKEEEKANPKEEKIDKLYGEE